MLLTINYQGQNTTNLGFLLYKNPYRPQKVELSTGSAYVFYPEISPESTTVSLLLDIDPLDLSKGKVGSKEGGLFEYVNDRPYVSSSFMSTAIARVFGTAMTGRADSHQDLADSPLELTATVTMLPFSGDEKRLNQLYEPLGYQVTYERFLLDEAFPQWGEGRYVNLTLKGQVRLRDLLRQLYILIPIFDRRKHYWVNEEEVEKLQKHGEGWLDVHPMRRFIVERYLYFQRSLVSQVLGDRDENDPERKSSLNEQRLSAVVDHLKSSGLKTVIDLGCGEGRLLKFLKSERQFTSLAGMDVSMSELKRAAKRLHLDEDGLNEHNKIQLFQGSLTYQDERMKGFEAACIMEVIEHLDPGRLKVFEEMVFAFGGYQMVVLTTPNKGYNENYVSMDEDELRHSDHRFEWNRDEFAQWVEGIEKKYNYQGTISQIGTQDENQQTPTQMVTFVRQTNKL